MHGLGNDYIYVDCMEQRPRFPEEVIRRMSDRHFGVGSDGLILICPSDRADFQMRMYNADGSEGLMCGNGIRCVGKYVYDHRLTEKTELDVETKSGVRRLRLTVEDGKAVSVRVDMGRADLRARDIPVACDYDEFISQPMLVRGEAYLVTAVSMGNPHAVVFCDDVDLVPLETVGPLFECNERFPKRVNTEFVQPIDRRTLKLRVWERGSGETFACGTGACAAVVAAILNGHCGFGEEITVRLPGGELRVTVEEDYTVYLEGPATHVFDGVIDLDL